MIPSRLAIAMSAATVLALPSVAYADGPLIGDTFCFPGAFQACASVSVHSIEFNPTYPNSADGQTTIVFRVVNLEGRPGVPNSEPYAIWSLRLSEMSVVCEAGDLHCLGGLTTRASASVGGGASQVGASGDGRDGQGIGWDPSDFAAGTVAVQSQSYGYSRITGCSLSTPSLRVVDDLSTCRGYVDVVVREIGEWTLTEASRLTVGAMTGPGTPISFYCTIGADCVSVTPEPTSIALLATGLTGLAGVRLRRRKKPAGIDA